MRPITTARQAAILEQLVELFLAEGFCRFTLDNYASRLHCSKTTLYVLGGDKDLLVARVIGRYFETVAEYVEQQIAPIEDPTERVVGYLNAVATALRRASPTFMEDIAGLDIAIEAYEDATAAAAKRVGEMIAEGVEAGAFRPVHAAFIADTVAATMERIQSGRVRVETGLQDPEAYTELAAWLIHGIRRPDEAPAAQDATAATPTPSPKPRRTKARRPQPPGPQATDGPQSHGQAA